MIVVSQSRVKLWRRCHKAHDYAWNQHVKRKAPPLPMLRGTIIHELIDVWSKGQDYNLVLKKYEKQYRQLFAEEREIYGDLIEDIRRIFENYLRTFENEPLKYEGSELELEIPLGEDIVFVAHIDKVVRDQRDHLWIQDHKSHKNIPGPDQRMTDLQLVTYAWLWNQLSGEKVIGVTWDYIRAKPPTIPDLLKSGELSQSKNISTDYYTYLKAIRDNRLDVSRYTEMLQYLKEQPNKFFERVWLPTSQTMEETVVKDLRATATEISILGETLKDRNLTRDCSSCQFFNLCQAELRGHDADFIRKSQYITEAPRGRQEGYD